MCARARQQEFDDGETALSRAEIGRRLRVARENYGLTQQAVAEAIRLPRTAVVQIEAGNRAVGSLELSRFAHLFGRPIEEFLSEAPFEEDPLAALFRTSAGVAENQLLAGELRRCAHLCRQATRLEQLLGLTGWRSLSVGYSLDAPSSRWEAIVQGRYLAEQERKRLDLGTSPVWEIAEIIGRQGIRVTECEMPEEISGLFFHSHDVGLVIVVNRRHPRTRRLFSYAHEYCHLLADRARPGNVSRSENRQELWEIRANAFAAHFLMPEGGVRAFLQSLGKGQSTRQEMEIFDGVEELPAQKRLEAGSQELQVHDGVLLAHHFGVSYAAALYHLHNLKLITRDRLEALLEQPEGASSLARAMRLSCWDEDVHWSLTERILALALEACRRGEITESKLYELADETGAPRADLRLALAQDGQAAAPVEAILPE